LECACLMASEVLPVRQIRALDACLFTTRHRDWSLSTTVFVTKRGASPTTLRWFDTEFKNRALGAFGNVYE